MIALFTKAYRNKKTGIISDIRSIIPKGYNTETNEYLIDYVQIGSHWISWPLDIEEWEELGNKDLVLASTE